MSYSKKEDLNYQLRYIPYNTPIKRIIHISDIHIHLYKRHEEYQIVFDKLLKCLQDEKKRVTKSDDNTEIPIIAVITGDILHSKSDLSPECIQITYQLFKDISNIMPCLIIPGNHDLNMNNKNRLDSLTPIISDLPNYNPIHYLNETGIWKMGNLVFGHASIFDYHIIEPKDIDNLLKKEAIDTKTITKIALYHGRINGVELFNGSKIDGEINTTTKKTITPSNFSKYDLSLFGDIHKHQFLDKKKSQAYAGSLIQQNFGEDIENHGYIQWDIEKKKGQFVNIPNDTGFYTFQINEGNCDYLKKDGIHFKPQFQLPKNLRARLFYTKTTHVQLEDFIANLGQHHNVLEYSIQNVESSISRINNEGELETIDANSVREIDITDYNYQNAFLRQIMGEDYEDVPEEDIKAICQLNQENNEKLQELETENSTPITSSKFKILRLEFSNLFSFGGDNVIDFQNCRGTVGIIAANHMGKSAILDILLYALYDQFPRKGSAKDILNNRKKDFNIKLETQIGANIYTIIKSGKRNTTGIGVKCNTHFMRRNTISGRVEQLNRDNDKDTKRYITQFFGNYDDMINTNFSIQTDSTGFIDAENTARRKELERILKFDFINKLIKEANNEFKTNKSVFEHLQKNMPPEKIISIKKDIDEHELLLIQYQETQEELQSCISNFQDSISDLNKNYNPHVDTQIEELIQDIDLKKEELLNEDLTSKQLIKSKLAEFKEQKSYITSLQERNISNIRNDFINLLETPSPYTITPEMKETPSKLSSNTSKLSSKDITLINSTLDNYLKIIQDEKKTISKKISDHNSRLKQLQNSKHQFSIFKKRPDFGVSYKFPVKLMKKLLSQTNFTTSLETPLSITGGEKQIITQEWNKGLVELDKLLEKRQEMIEIKEKWENKITKYEKILVELQDKNEELLTNDLPDFLKDELKDVSITDLISKVDMLENKILGNKNKIDVTQLNDFKGSVALLGWFSRLNDIEKENSSIAKKIEDNKAVIVETKEKLSKAKSSLKKKEKNISELENIETLQDEIKEHLASLDEEFTIFENNKCIENDILLVENEVNNLQKLYLDEESKERVEKIKQMVLLYQSSNVELLKIKEQMKSMKGVEEEIDKLHKEGMKNKKIHEEILITMNNKNGKEDELSKVNVDIEIVKDKISSLMGQIEELHKQSREKIEIERKMNLYGLYRDCLKVIPLKLISQIKPLLERKINDLLTVVTDFTLQFEITDSKIEIYLNRPSYKGRMIMIRNSSGFERFISSLAIRIALMEISQLSSPNMMAIDEGWSCFDNENIGNIGVILDHLKMKFDFILTISHMQLIRQNCDTQISLEKDEKGFSCVKYGS